MWQISQVGVSISLAQLSHVPLAGQVSRGTLLGSKSHRWTESLLTGVRAAARRVQGQEVSSSDSRLAAASSALDPHRPPSEKASACWVYPSAGDLVWTVVGHVDYLHYRCVTTC